MNEKIDVQKVVDWLNSQWQGPKVCPICKSNNWNISEKLLELREFHEGSFVVGGPVYPLIAITCKVCGHTLFFNAIVAGVLTPKQGSITPAEKTESTRKEDE